jgi:hypothetical protein
METAPSETPIEHQDVPIAHQGLHDFLYSSVDEHGVGANVATPVAAIDDAAIVALDDWCDRAGDTKVAGVYAVFDADRQLQYVNISRNVSLSLRGHQTQLGADCCAFVRVQSFSFPDRAAMAAVQADWIAANGVVPIGNADTDGLWAATVGAAAIAAMSPAERAAYEEKKLKLRKAMADSTLSQDLPAVAQGDDWSSVIQTQTQATL